MMAKKEKPKRTGRGRAPGSRKTQFGPHNEAQRHDERVDATVRRLVAEILHEDGGEQLFKTYFKDRLKANNASDVAALSSLLKLASGGPPADEGGPLEKLVATVAERTPEQVAQFEWSDEGLAQVRLDNLFRQLREQGTSRYADMARAFIDAILRDPRWRRELRCALKAHGPEPDTQEARVALGAAYGSERLDEVADAAEDAADEPEVEAKPVDPDAPDPRTISPDGMPYWPPGSDRHGRKIQ